MNKWNNQDTLEHFEGMIWVSNLFKTERRGNICFLKNDEFRVLAYISPDMLENKTLSTVVHEIVKANGTLYMLYEEPITCSICGKSYNEADVNIVDYPDDVCIKCEKTYVESSKKDKVKLS